MAPLLLSVSCNMISDGLIGLNEECSGRAAGGGVSRAAEAEGGTVAVCYPGVELTARHLARVYVCVQVARALIGSDVNNLGVCTKLNTKHVELGNFCWLKQYRD